MATPIQSEKKEIGAHWQYQEDKKELAACLGRATILRWKLQQYERKHGLQPVCPDCGKVHPSPYSSCRKPSRSYSDPQEEEGRPIGADIPQPAVEPVCPRCKDVHPNPYYDCGLM